MIRPHYVPLYQSVCHSEKLADLREKDARFFYCCLLTHCDSYGRTGGRTRVLHSKLWAMFGTPESIPKILADLERVGLIVRYEAGGEPYIAIPDWEEKAGKVGRPDRRGPETIPAPPSRGSSPASCGSSPATPDMHDEGCGSSPASRARLDPSQAEQSQAEPRDPADEPPEPAKKPRKEPTGDQATCVKWWCERWLQSRGVEYQPARKDFVAVAAMLKKGPVDEVMRRMDRMLTDPDPFVFKNASPPWLDSRWNQYGITAPPPRPGPSVSDYETVRAPR